ncbi:unnamed protein product [Schistosoma rodhaini]|uniref:Apple domain-containing protein n=1 Tax=Schistosoma rodhaini TaxID=6188 RepID=A0AA85F4C2_9TREM|nr:unnamed protein product [Schistosoma rodhaini]
MHITFRCLFISHIIIHCCFSDSKLANKRNYYFMPHKHTFCEANKLCYEYGLLVDKRWKLPVFEDLQYIHEDAKLNTFWLEYNALFTPRIDDYIIWQYHDISIELIDLKKMQTTNLPLSCYDKRYCVIHTKSGILEGVHCNSVNNVICVEASIQHVNKLLDTNSSILLKTFTIEKRVDTKFVSMYNETDGCYDLFTKHNIYDCILQCAETVNCMSGYFNQFQSRCIIILYHQSLLPHQYSDSISQWLRFIANY